MRSLNLVSVIAQSIAVALLCNLHTTDVRAQHESVSVRTAATQIAAARVSPQSPTDPHHGATGATARPARIAVAGRRSPTTTALAQSRATSFAPAVRTTALTRASLTTFIVIVLVSYQLRRRHRLMRSQRFTL